MDEMRRYTTPYIKALVESEERLAEVLKEVVLNLRLGHLDSKLGLENQLLRIDAVLKKRPDSRDACTGIDEDQS